MEANPNFNQFEHFDGHAHTQHHTTIYIEVAREIWVWVETYGPKIWRAYHPLPSSDQTWLENPPWMIFPTKSPLIGGFHLAMRTTGGKSWKSPASWGSADPKCWRLRHCQRKTWWLWLVRGGSQEPQCHRFPKDLGLKIWVKPPKSHCENQISCVKICNKCIQMPWNGYPMVSPIFVDEDLSSKKWKNTGFGELIEEWSEHRTFSWLMVTHGVILLLCYMVSRNLLPDITNLWWPVVTASHGSLSCIVDPCFDTFIVALFCSSADWWLLILFGALAGCKLKHSIYTQHICIVSYVTCFNHDTDTNATLLSAIMMFNKSGTGKPGQVLIHQVHWQDLSDIEIPQNGHNMSY